MKRIIKNIERFEALIKEGFIVKNKHPEANLWIYNYSQKTQYDCFWNEYTLNCRGLILDDKYNIVAKTLPKFFNIEEIGHDKLPDESFTIHEKLDGSLGILYWLNDKPYIATRSSFTSIQAVKANQLLQSKYNHLIPKLEKNKTYIFEIIYPSNRIVVNYGTDEHLILLAIIDNNTLKEEPLMDLGFPLPKTYKNIDLKTLKSLNKDNEEGFVIKFEHGFRVKIKFENYIELHRIVTQVSSRTVWDELKENGHLREEWLNNVPDEFYKWVKAMENRLKNAYLSIENKAKKDFLIKSTDKETAEYFLSCQYSTIMFAIKNNKPYEQYIWRMVKPEFEKAFVTKKKS
ncbi:MAG: RNA ligase [Flavobacteriales bacterium]